jgi:adenosylmethionine-8-amino-7-oxononanoate aminotransferase
MQIPMATMAAAMGGHAGDHFLVAPPMIVTDAQVDDIMDRLTDALAAFAAEAFLADAG